MDSPLLSSCHPIPGTHTINDGQNGDRTPAVFIVPGYFCAGWRYFSISGASSMEGIISGTSVTFAACS